MNEERAMARRPSKDGGEMASATAGTKPREAVSSPRYPKATTREGKRQVSAYLDPEAFRQLKRIAVDEDCQQQELLIEGINAVFEKRGLPRSA